MEQRTLENDVVTNGFDGGVLHLLRVTRAQCHASVAFAALRKEDGSLDITSLPSAEEGSDWPSSTLEGIVRQTLEDPLIGDSKAVIRVSDVFRRLWHGERVHTRMAVAPLNDEAQGDEPWGLLCALGPAGGQFSEADLDMLGRLALRFMNQVRARRQIMRDRTLADSEAVEQEEPSEAAPPIEPDTWFTTGEEPTTIEEAAASSNSEEETVEPTGTDGEESTIAAETEQLLGSASLPSDVETEPEMESTSLFEEEEFAEPLVEAGPTAVEPELYLEAEFFSASGEIFEGPSLPEGETPDEEPLSPVAGDESLVKEHEEAAEKYEMSPEDRIAALIEGPAVETPAAETAPASDGPERVAAFLRRLDEVVAEARTNNSPAAVIVIELSKQSGPLSSEEVAAAANWLFSQTRFDDFVSRIATSTFAVVLPLRAMPQDLPALRRRFSEATAAAAAGVGEGVTSASSILPVEPGDSRAAEDFLFRAIRQLSPD